MSAFLISFLCAISKINTTRMDARMLEEGRVNKKIPPQVEQVEKVLKGAQGSRNSRVPIMAEVMILLIGRLERIYLLYHDP